MKIPSDYQKGYKKALQIDGERATNYVAHTTIGDPLADELVDDLSHLEHNQSAELLKTALSADSSRIGKDAPASLKKFMEFYDDAPEWVDFDAMKPGFAMFHRNTRFVLAGMVAGTLVEGFTTNISLSFFIKGRLRYQGIKRLQQNNRHMLEIFLPGGLEKHGDGWALSIRVRLVHARSRQLLYNASEWDSEVLGVPLSSAHIGFAICAFSARLLGHMKALGATFDDEEREAFMQVWRYSGYLMGIPETILYKDEDDALDLFAVGRVCEPPVSMESIAMAWSLINSAPLLSGTIEREERIKLAELISRVSRVLIGDELADDLSLPKGNQTITMMQFKLFNLIEKTSSMFNRMNLEKRYDIAKILQLSHYGTHGISYRLPDHYYDEESSEW
ncbi:MAG: DUF2236 domain-containing protein [Gammaproteobacteria bacterium]|nr:DUF2236 domain-containing protein [Gammaproteobacteria bacterium]MYI90224.1 DUF2236 domain-containing protein [Gammaproteobacteria bacterium]